MGQLQSLLGKISSNKKTIFILLLIFLFAFGIRAHLMQFDLMFEFDSYYHARMASLVAQGDLRPVDSMSYYFLSNLPEQGLFFWILNAILFNILTLGSGLLNFSKDSWILYVKFAPAFFGALISVTMYFFGKELLDKKAGYAMAFFAAVVPSFVYRTMAGFFEDDSLGFLWFVIGFVFFIRAVKEGKLNKNSIINGVLAVFFFCMMALTWEMFLLIPLVIITYFGSTLFLLWFKKENQSELRELAKITVVIIVLFSVFATLLTGPSWFYRDIDYVIKFLPISTENIARIQNQDTGLFGLSVGEENTGWQFFGQKYSLLILFPILAFLLIPLDLLKNKKTNKTVLIIFFWAAIAGFMAVSKLKFTYGFGLPIAACAGFVFFKAFELMEKRTGFEKKAIGVAMVFMLVGGAAAGTYFMQTNMPHMEMDTGWKQSLYWLKENTPADAKIFNWWDEGHWISFIGERQVLIDNRNLSIEADQNVAQFVLTENPAVAKKITDYYGSDYIMFGSDLLTSQQSLQAYAYGMNPSSDPRFRETFGIQFPCFMQADQLNGNVSYKCGQNTLQESEMNSLPYIYSPTPNIFLDERTPGFVYKAKDNSMIYLLNTNANNTFIAHLWFKDPSIKNYEEIYWNKNVKIFKIKK